MRVARIIHAASGTDLTLSIPLPRWMLRTRRVGGSAVADSGLAVTYVRRRDRLCDVTLRVLESERSAVEAWLDAVENHGASEFRFDASDPATAHTVYVDAPRVGDADIEWEPDDFLGAWRVTLTLRTTDGARFTTPYLDA